VDSVAVSEQPGGQPQASGLPDRPVLKHCTTRSFSDDKPMLMIVGSEYFELTEEVGSREDFLTVKRYLDGRHTISQIAARAGVDEESVRDIVATFADLDLLGKPRPMDFVPGPELVKQVEDACRMWGQQIGFHPLFSGLEAGTLRPEVLMGLLLETYHYINSAPKHIATAIAHCRDERLLPLLSQHFVDEWDHARHLLEGLKLAGLPRAHAETAYPVIGTWSLVNNLCEVARQDTLSYIAATALFEARADDYELGRESLLEAVRKAGFSEATVEPLLTHMRLDVEANHVGLFPEAVEILGDIPAADAHRVVNNIHDLKHSFDQFHDQIVHFYSDISNHIPRSKMDFFLL